MADVVIDATTDSFLVYHLHRFGIFWTSETTGYVIYIDESNDLVYSKTVNGGANWAAANLLATGDVFAVDCWADWQTAGDAGTKIHIVCATVATDDILYVYLDTSDDSEGTDVIEAVQGTGTIRNSKSPPNNYCSITKTRGGNLAVAIHYQDSDLTNFYSFYTSPDGDTWTSENTPWEGAADYVQLYPANLADNNDLWCAFWDYGALEISLKTYDDSGNSWTTIGEASISGSMYPTNQHIQMDGHINIKTGHLFLVAWTRFDNADSDLKVWDIDGAGSITAKTPVIENEAENIQCSILINQDNNDIYVAYLVGSSAGSSLDCVYKKSVDGGANWGSETILSDNTQDDHRSLSSGAVKAAWGGFFMPVWSDVDDADLFTSTANAITIAAAGAPAEAAELGAFYQRRSLFGPNILTCGQVRAG